MAFTRNEALRVAGTCKGLDKDKCPICMNDAVDNGDGESICCAYCMLYGTVECHGTVCQYLK
jgi:hypothetical protein